METSPGPITTVHSDIVLIVDTKEVNGEGNGAADEISDVRKFIYIYTTKLRFETMFCVCVCRKMFLSIKNETSFCMSRKKETKCDANPNHKNARDERLIN